MPHLLLVGHWKVLKTKTNTVRAERFAESLLGHANPTAVESCLCLRKTVWMWSMADCELPQTRSLGSASHNDWISDPVLIQPKKRTLNDTDVRHIRHTQKNAAWLHTISALHRPPPTGRVMHLCCSARDGIFRRFTSLFIYSNYLWRQHFEIKRKINVRKGHVRLPSLQNHGCLVFIDLIWFEMSKNSKNNHVPSMALAFGCHFSTFTFE